MLTMIHSIYFGRRISSSISLYRSHPSLKKKLKVHTTKVAWTFFKEIQINALAFIAAYLLS